MSCQRFAHEDPVIVPLDVTLGSDLSRLEVSLVFRLGSSFGIRARGAVVQTRRSIHLNPFMGTFEVVSADELIESLLLLLSAGRGRYGRFGLQITMHPLMSTVILRSPRSPKHRQHVEFHQPNTER